MQDLSLSFLKSFWIRCLFWKSHRNYYGSSFCEQSTIHLVDWHLQNGPNMSQNCPRVGSGRSIIFLKFSWVGSGRVRNIIVQAGLRWLGLGSVESKIFAQISGSVWVGSGMWWVESGQEKTDPWTTPTCWAANNRWISISHPLCLAQQNISWRRKCKVYKMWCAWRKTHGKHSIQENCKLFYTSNRSTLLIVRVAYHKTLWDEKRGNLWLFISVR